LEISRQPQVISSVYGVFHARALLAPAPVHCDLNIQPFVEVPVNTGRPFTDRKPKILVLVGTSGAGKTECAQQLEQQGFYYREASQYTKAVTRTITSPDGPREVPFVRQDAPMREHCAAREELYREVGNDYAARKFVEELRRERPQSNYAVLSGVRKWEDVQYLRQQGYHVEVVALFRDSTAAFIYGRVRAIQERREDHPESLEEFIQLNAWEYSIGLGRLIHEADHVLVNSGDRRVLTWLLNTIVHGRPTIEEVSI
jgi:dephospho-CoA kinase